MKLMVMMTMVQEEVDDEEIRNAYEFDLGEEEDVRAHSTRAEDFNFSEFIFILPQKIDVLKNTFFDPLNLNIKSLPPLIINKKTSESIGFPAPPDKLTLSPPRHRPTHKSLSSPSYQEPTKQKLSYKDRCESQRQRQIQV